MIIRNRKAKFDFNIIDEFEAGLILKGSEVKSIRKGDANISDSFIYIKDNRVFIKNMRVAAYKNAHKLEEHDENRDKEMLLNKKEIIKIQKELINRGTAVITLGIIVKNNKLKAIIATAKGKREFDKKESIKKKEIEREVKRNTGINL